MAWTRRWARLLRCRAAAPPGALPVRGTVHAVRGAVRAVRGLVPAGPGPHAPERSPAPFALTPQWRAPGPCGARRPRSARPGSHHVRLTLLMSLAPGYPVYARL